MVMQKELQQYFHEVFSTTNTESLQYFFAPGRINLIGEHTDYNGGHVLPAALSFGTYAVARKRNDDIIQLHSIKFPEKGIVQCKLSDLSFDKEHGWASYPIGMIHYVREQGFEIDSGMDIVFYGTIPLAAGLSSSASIELVTGVLLEGLFNLKISRMRLIQTGQRVENEYIGVNSGVMDQFTVAMGKKDNAILLDCETLEYVYAPIKLVDHTIIIINTNKKRALTESKYNERRVQCEQALIDIKSIITIANLCHLTIEEFELNKHHIKNDINRKRAKHVVYENDRTIIAASYLRKGDLVSFGKLMNESHQSLHEDYEVTGVELDALVHTAWKQDGVIGARMTGAGFGGCAIAIVENDSVEKFKQNVSVDYINAVGVEPTFYKAVISNGAMELFKGVNP